MSAEEGMAYERVTAGIHEPVRPARLPGWPDARNRDAFLVREPKSPLRLHPPFPFLPAPVRVEVLGGHQHRQDGRGGDLGLRVLGERRHGVEALAGAVLLVEEYLDLSTEVRNT